MCGITGIVTNGVQDSEFLENVLKSAITSLHHRGPDSNGSFSDQFNIQHSTFNISLGHTRLSIIDTSASSSQPFYSSDGRYVLVYNGEIFNFKELRAELMNKGVSFETTGDTEVLLKLYIYYSTSNIQHSTSTWLSNLNGFFAFAIYDKHEKSLFMARDRFGIKPLFYYSHANQFIFASELKALMEYPIEKKLDYTSLLEYLQLNYIPAPNTMLEGIKKFPAGHFLKLTIDKGQLIMKEESFIKENYPWSDVPYTSSYDDTKKTFYNLLDDSVQKRMLADVPLGTFLSGGLDSSAITAIAALHKPDIMSFSIGYKDEPMFDETFYAEMVSKKVHSRHHTFKLDNQDLFGELYNILDTMGEPFGDSSCIPMYILSKKVSRHVKVALSGDGSDELMGGYNKHRAEYKLRTSPFGRGIKFYAPILANSLKALPHSRNTLVGNRVRQLIRFSEGTKLNLKDRYWEWASIANFADAQKLIENGKWKVKNESQFLARKASHLNLLSNDFNSLLGTDVNLVLQNDMLVKTDLMSMANSLEVRVPFLDYRLVEFLFSLPSDYKINSDAQKRILRDSVSHLLPPEILIRKKQGFEVPLLKWFKTELRSSIESLWLADDFIEEQGIFDVNEIKALKKKLFSSNPMDSVARVWGLIAFQQWYKSNLMI